MSQGAQEVDRGAQLAVATEAAGIAPARLLRWIVACAGLSAAWFVEDGEDASRTLAVADLAGPGATSGHGSRLP